MNKVCHVSTLHSVTDVRIFHKECKSLQKAGYQVTLVCAQNETSVNEIDGITIHLLSGKAKNRIKRFFQNNRKLKVFFSQNSFDVIHFHDPELIFFMMKLHRKGQKVVYDVHEDLPRQIDGKYYIPKFLRKPISFLAERLEKYASKRFAGIITATDYITKRFLEYNKNTVTVSNFPLLIEFEISETIQEKQAQVCYAGGLSKIRGIGELVQAIALVPGIKLALAGNFDPVEYRNELTKIRGWEQVIEKGFLNRSEIFQLYSESIAGLITLHPQRNYLDALPVKMFEYMASGIPVIASDFPLWKKIVETHACGICVNPLHPAEIAKAIQYIKNNPDKACEMGENGRKAVFNKYNWNIEEKKMLQFYKNLLSS